jgi:hypothetical protein
MNVDTAAEWAFEEAIGRAPSGNVYTTCMTNSLTTMEMQYNNRLAKRTSLQEPAHGTLEHQGGR